jgi:hypothetical protein
MTLSLCIFLTTCAEHLQWIEKSKNVFNPAEGHCTLMRFLRPKVTDDYNMGMNGVDVADQLRNQYRVDHWMRKRKWWWSIWWWGIQVLLVNSYLLYKTAQILVWKKNPKSVMTQYDFRYKLVMAWFGVLQAPSTRKRLFEDSSISMSTSTSTAPSSIKRAKHVNDSSLDPSMGSLRDRLSSEYHYIEPSKSKDPVCSLCRWANTSKGSDRMESRVRGKSIGSCDKCGVNLCLKCFKPFHTIGNVGKLRSEVLQQEKS